VKISEAHLLVDNLVVPEGPRWRENELYVSDLLGGEVLAIDLTGKRRSICSVPQRPSGLGWLPDGRLLVVSMLDRKLLASKHGVLEEYVDLAPLCEARCNDMVVDGRRHAYIGEFPVGSGDDPIRRIMSAPPSKLVMVDFTDLERPSARVVANEMHLPNGMVVTADGKTLIVAETSARRLTAFDIEDDGSLSGRRVWAELPNLPDGICLDEDNCVWVASPFPPSGFYRIAEGGKILDQLTLENTAAFACMLGGPTGRTLFMLESKYPPDESGRFGRIRTIEVARAGAGMP
jgi:sugar lactone lactonase YvrE